MAQADSVPNSSRQLITGGSTDQSTNLRGVNLTATRVDRRHLIDGLHATAIIGGDEVRLIWREKRGDEPEGVLERRCYGASLAQTPVSSNIEALFYANPAFCVGQLLRRIVRTLQLFVSGNKRLRNCALGNVSSNQLVPSRPEERPR